MNSALSLEQTPPLAVPARYFLTAPLFAAAAAVLLLWEGPAALAGRWSPTGLALTHLLTLGFIAMVMVGAVQQLLPVLAGAPIRHALWASRVLHVLLSAGTVALAVGLWAGAAAWLHGAALLLLAFVLGFAAAAGEALARSRSSHATVTAMALSVAALAVTAALGLYLAAGHMGAGVPLARQWTDVHLAWGLAGWVGLMVIGVAYQVVPMFQVTPDYPRAVVRWLGPAVFLGLVAWSSGVFLERGTEILGAWLAGLGALIVAAGLAAFAVITLRLQAQRRRRLPDVTLSFWRIGLASLLLAVALAVALAVRPDLQAVLALPLGVAVVAGFAVSVINGMLYKIVPFLVWLHLTNRMQWTGAGSLRVPNMKQVIPERRTRIQLWLHGAALSALLAAALLPGPLTYLAAALFLLSNGLLWINLLDGVLLYRRTCRACA